MWVFLRETFSWEPKDVQTEHVITTLLPHYKEITEQKPGLLKILPNYRRNQYKHCAAIFTIAAVTFIFFLKITICSFKAELFNNYVK